MLKAKLDKYLQCPGATADTPKTFSEGLVHENFLANVVVFRGSVPKTSVTIFNKKFKGLIPYISLRNDFIFEEKGETFSCFTINSNTVI